MQLFVRLFNQKCFQFILMCFITTIHLIVTPFTKVEESFQLQATHDFLNIGYPKLYQCIYISLISGQLEFDTARCWTKIENLDVEPNQSNLYNILPKPRRINHKKWDHEEFPGIVPRTFIPSFVLSTMSLPFKLITKSTIFFQLLVRLNLSILIILAMLKLSENVRSKFGNYVGSVFIVITCTQFHFIFYSSRTLPNTSALLLVILGYSFWLKKQFSYLIVTSAFCVVIFRFETCFIFGTIFLIELFIKKRIDLSHFLSVGVLAGLAAICTTVLFDSIFWGKIIWPELESFYFNVYLNKSHLWGTLPFYWYFLVVIPKLMLFSLPFFLVTSSECIFKFYPVILVHVGVHSFLPHKELRFIIYILPLLNICAANTIANLFKIIDPSTNNQSIDEAKNTYLDELSRVYDAKEFSSYRPFQKDEHKELEKIRPHGRKENHLRKRNKMMNESMMIAEYVFSYGKTSLVCDGYNYLKRIKSIMKTDIDQQNTMDRSLCDQADDQIKNLNSIDSEVIENQSLDDTLEFDQKTSDKKTDEIATNKKLITSANTSEQPSFTFLFIAQFMCIVLHFCLNFAVSTFILFISFYNYPGGDAVIWLNDNIPKNLNQFNLNASDVGVHIGNLAAQTGFSRFAEWESIAYDKSPNFLNATRGDQEHSIHENSQSLNLDLTKYKLVFLVLDNIKPDLLNQHCRIIKQSNQNAKLPYVIDKFECDFNKLRNCRVNSVIYGFFSVHLKLDSKFMNIAKTPMIYIYRCLNL